MSTTFGYSPDRAQRIRDQLDRDLSALEYRLGRIRNAVPHAGAIASRLEAVQEEVSEVVSDLHDLVDERTEVPA